MPLNGPGKAGPLRHRVTILLPAAVKNAFGETAAATPTIVATRRASVKPTSGREYLRGDQMVAEGTMLVWMRYYKGLSAKNLLQVTVDGILLTLEIIQVSLVREVKMWHELVCKQLES